MYVYCKCVCESFILAVGLLQMVCYHTTKYDFLTMTLLV